MVYPNHILFPNIEIYSIYLLFTMLYKNKKNNDDEFQKILDEIYMMDTEVNNKLAEIYFYKVTNR